jgi:NAD(P)H-flavin reductase
MLAAAERWGGGEGERPFLPRAFSYLRSTPIASASPPAGPASPGPAAGPAHRVEFLWEDVGPGTERLSELQPGDGLWLLGPLGIGFAHPPGPGFALLVGGGVGIVPLACWEDELHEAALERDWDEAPPPRVLLGFRDADHAPAADLLRAPRVATDDGSVGYHGLVTELLVAELEADDRFTVYACGPPPMLESVRAICAERDIRAQLALESGMACGFGACFGCVVPTRDGYVRLCVDGPVLNAGALEEVAVH